MASAAEDYLGHALALFSQAQASAARQSVHHLRIGSAVIELRIAGEGMARHVMPALGHRRTAHVVRPDLVLCLWDSATTSTPPLLPHWSPQDCEPTGLIRGFNDARHRIAMQFSPRILRGLDRQAGIGFYWTASAQALPFYERGAPLRPLLHDWLREKAMLPIHGGAVGFADGGVLLAGPGGAGKSNAALSCLRSPLRYASDDFCVLTGDPWTVHSLYSSGKVNADSLLRLSHLRHAVSNPDRLDAEKALFFLEEAFADCLIGGFPLKALVLPRICPSERSRLLPLSAATMHKAMAMSTIELLPSAAAEIFSKTAALARSLPCYELRVGEAGPRVAELLIELLASLGSVDPGMPASR